MPHADEDVDDTADLDNLSMAVKEYPAESRPSVENEEEGALLKDSRPSRGRSNTLSRFSFEYTRNLLPLPLSSEQDVEGESKAALSVISGIALNAGVIIGSGIFASPGTIVADTQSVGASMIVWVAGGLLAWTGASSYAELGSAIPLNGGSQAYLQYAFGPGVAYCYAWTSITAVKPGSAAIISLVFAEYLCRVFYHTAFAASSEESVEAIPLAVIKLVAISIIILISALNMLSNTLGRRTQVVTTAAKIIVLFLIAIAGIVQLARGQASSSLRGNTFANSSTSPGAYALALYSGLWAFDGWDQVNMVAAELANTSRDLPRVIHISIAAVLLLFIITNLSFYIVLPRELVAHSNTVALDFGKAIFGPVGGLLLALVVALSCFGSLNGGLYTTARLIRVAGQEGFLPKTFAKLHSTRETPLNAILLNGALTLVMILFGDFKSLVIFFSISAWTFYFATVSALLVLRVREPDLPRPYKTYLATPIVFTCTALFLLFMPIVSSPIAALLSFTFMIAGLPIYFLTQRSQDLYAALPVQLDAIKSKFGRQSTAEEDDELDSYKPHRLSRVDERDEIEGDMK